MSDEWVLVPRNPTNAMIRAACAALADSNRPSPDYLSVKEKHAHRWRMMVDAAPPPPFRVAITVTTQPKAVSPREMVEGWGANTPEMPCSVCKLDIGTYYTDLLGEKK